MQRFGEELVSAAFDVLEIDVPADDRPEAPGACVVVVPILGVAGGAENGYSYTPVF